MNRPSTEKPHIGIMFNEDVNHHFGESAAHKGPDFALTEETEARFVDQYRGTQLTDFLINVNFLRSVYPSKIRESYCDNSAAEGECNPYYNTFIRDGFDPFSFWIRRFRKIGVRPWLSFRMNDVHGIAEHNDSMLISFWKEHPELYRIRHHAPDGYFARTLDYGEKAVRDEMLAYMNEALERYDADGVEMDFMREMFCFKPGWEYKNMGIMTDFVREVRALCDRFEKKRGHRILLGMKLGPLPHQMYYQGFDLFTYAKEHLLDTLAVGARWETTDNDVPIEVWKQILEPYGVQVAAVQELILRVHPHGRWYYLNTHETDLGAAAAYRSAGADFTYFYNHMRPTEVDYSRDWVFPLYQEENYQLLMKNAGEPETAIHAPRRHVITWHDIENEWETPKLSQLPWHAENNFTYRQIRLRCGRIPEGSKAYLILGAKSDTKQQVDASDFDIYFNSVRLTCRGTCDVTPYTKWTGYWFPIEDLTLADNINTVELACVGDAFTVEYAEIRVNASLEKTQWEKDTLVWQDWDKDN